MSTAVHVPSLGIEGRRRLRIRVRGVVQGVGFRPFVYVSATELHLSGSVSNDSEGVLIEVEGRPADVDAFVQRLDRRPPPLAIIDSIETVERPTLGGNGFRITETKTGVGRTFASADVATCDECLAELTDPDDRRHRHPFITCTNCGPRFTIMTALPYDRVNTTMAGFPMCAACAAEYRDPTDRRFHAQPVACHDCGPTLELLHADRPAVTGAEAMERTRELLGAGAILAVKGVGGYHLVCDGGNDVAVAELRSRKRRGDKPFAVMVPDLATAERLVDIRSDEAAALRGPARPIVLLPRRPFPDLAVSDAVAPGHPDLGVMLPYTPVHTLLFGLPGDDRSPRVLVMTSGNTSGEPIVTDDGDALDRLRSMVDGWLRHDRAIRVPCDDSVIRMIDGHPQAIRRSRGWAPLPIALPVPVAPLLAAGAELKNTCAIADGGYAWVSQHIGDLDDLRSIETLDRTAGHLKMLTGIEPEATAADLHPAYRSSAWARRQERPVVPVQHHHAHICSVLAEHGRLDRPVIGIAFDGTGFGPDRAVWGGEVLIARYSNYHRFAHLGYVPLPGGDAAVERPYRMALSHLVAAGVPWTDELPCVAACPPTERIVLQRQLQSGFGCVPTSSMGRLFDAVSAIAGVRQVADYEAQAAVELEGLSRSAFEGIEGPYRFGWLPGPALQALAGPVITAVAADVLAGVDAAVIGARFHQAVVDLVVELALRSRAATGLETVALSGGVFQNVLLVRGAITGLQEQGFQTLRNQRVPPNDGGLALGQLVVAGVRQSRKGVTPCA